jgi:hypothetical protein
MSPFLLNVLLKEGKSVGTENTFVVAWDEVAVVGAKGVTVNRSGVSFGVMKIF